MATDITPFVEQLEEKRSLLPPGADPEVPAPSKSYKPMEYLNYKQQIFCLEYVKDFNGRQAAIRAGYEPKNAHTQASQLLNNYNVSLAIAQILDDRKQRIGTDGDMVLRELGYIALSDIMNYKIDDEGYVDLANEDVPSEVMRAVKAIKRRVTFGEGGSKTIETEIVLWDKMSALKLLGQHLSMFIEKHEVEHSGTIQHEQKWIVGGREIKFT